jgi:hypothetical protein
VHVNSRPAKNQAFAKSETETLEEALRRLLPRILQAESGYEADAGELKRLILENNQRTATLIKQLVRITNTNRFSHNADKVKHLTEVVQTLDVTPLLGESLANVKRERIGSSYRYQRLAWWFSGRSAKLNPNYVLRSKRDARDFASLVGLPVPEMRQQCVPHTEVKIKGATVVKPAWEDGGKAVHGLVPDGKGFVDLFDKRKVYASLDEFHDYLKFEITKKFIKRDEWNVEELVVPSSGRVEDGRDVKFFVFYGTVGYVLQVDRWSGELPTRAMFNTDGVAINASSMYALPKHPVAPAFTKADIEMVCEISKKIPWPGVRIDFLTSSRGLVFGEFTVNPGAYGGFYDESDLFLGRTWASAAGRLYDDMVSGKRFPEFNAMLDKLGLPRPVGL